MPPNQSNAESKKTLRKSLRQALKEFILDLDTKKIEDEQILARLRSTFSLIRLPPEFAVAAYAERSSEFPISLALTLPQLSPYLKVFPVVDSNQGMDFYLPQESDVSIWRDGAFGIKEPQIEKSKRVSPSQIGIYLVPCLGVGPMGERLGNGKGYYDRYIGQKVPTDHFYLTVACIYDCQWTSSSSIFDEWDVRIDIVLSPSKVFLSQKAEELLK